MSSAAWQDFAGWLSGRPLWLWLLVLAALVGLAVGGHAAWKAWRAARWRRKPPIELESTVVLVHGIFGFDSVGIGQLKQDYFRGIRVYLQALGVGVHTPRLPMADSVSVRARQLAEFVLALPSERVLLVAHSMGGLDARYAIRHYGLAQRVAGVVSIGTPHHGTPIATIGSHGIFRLVRWVWARVGLKTGAVDWLTRGATATFNKEVLDVPGIQYASVVAAAGWASILLNPALWISYVYLRRRMGPNDGLVPAASQRWGRVLFEVDADHWAQVGWSWRYDAKAMYEHILRDFAQRGY